MNASRAPAYEALAVAMALAPGVYTRNRMFGFFQRSEAQSARVRSARLRGIVRHLPKATSITVESVAPVEGAQPTSGRFVLRYQLPQVRMMRAAELSRVELAVVRVLAQRLGVGSVSPDAEDHRCIEDALVPLLQLGLGAEEVVREDLSREAR